MQVLLPRPRGGGNETQGGHLPVTLDPIRVVYTFFGSQSTGSSGLGVAVVADVSISVAMVWYLRKGRTGLRK